MGIWSPPNGQAFITPSPEFQASRWARTGKAYIADTLARPVDYRIYTENQDGTNVLDVTKVRPSMVMPRTSTERFSLDWEMLDSTGTAGKLLSRHSRGIIHIAGMPWRAPMRPFNDILFSGSELLVTTADMGHEPHTFSFGNVVGLEIVEFDESYIVWGDREPSAQAS